MPFLNLNGLRKIAEKYRPIATPIRVTRVEVRKLFWPEGIGIGEPVEDTFVFPTYVKVREIRLQDVAGSGGKLEVGDVEVGPITPEFSGGGWTLEELAPASDDDKIEVKYFLTGAIVGEFRRMRVDSAKPFRYMLTLRRTL